MSSNTETAVNAADRSAEENRVDPVNCVKPSNPSVAKRAVWEAMEVRVLESGNVEVVNTSHDDPSEHVYHVITDSNGVPKWCVKDEGGDEWSDCPAMKWHCENDGDSEELIAAGEYEVCKHCYAVAVNDGLIRQIRAAKEGDD